MDNAEAVHPLSLEEKVVLTSAGLLLCCFGLVLGAWGEAARAQTAPVFNVTPLQVNSGGTVSVIWYAGPSAPGGCVVSVTDATRTNYAPWGLTQSGSGAVTIYSDTTFDAVCLGSGGDYVYPPTRTYTVKMYRPHTLSVSATSVQYGQTITVNWDGGSAAGLCGVSLTDATRTNYQPWGNSVTGSAQATLTSNTTFTLTCINKVDGAYLTPQRTASVAVAAPAPTAPAPTPAPEPPPPPPPPVITSCPSGQTLYSNECYQTQKACTVSNGVGIQTFSNGGYGACAVYACTMGYTMYDNACYGPHAHKISVSSSKVTVGDPVLVSWDGGTYAGNCAVYLTDATRTQAPFRTGLVGAVTHTVTSPTTFSMVCINKTNGAYLVPQPTASVALETAPGQEALTSRFSALNLKRALDWAQLSSLWEISWEGGGSTPGDGATTGFAWSLPFDDDWNEPRVASSSFAFDTPAPGFLTINRTDPRDFHKGGVIVRHDEYLNNSTGITIEFRAKVHPNSAEDAFNLIYSTGPGSLSKGATDPTFELFLSPNKIIAGGYGEQRINPNPPTVAFNTTDDFHIYRFVQQPDSKRFALYVDNNTAPIIEAEGNYHKVSFFDDHDTAYIMLGGESGNRPPNVTIDYVRYRRGAFPPGASFTTPFVRHVPPLPPHLSVGESFTTILDGTKTPPEAGYPLSRHPAEWAVMGDGTLKLDSRASTSTFHFIADPMPGVTDIKGPYTFEIRAKVLEGTTDRGFSAVVVNGKTGLALTLSPGKVETFTGLKPSAHQAHAMDTTDGFHIYRMVHPARSMYAFLYVDDDPVPVIVDQHGSADTWRDHLLLEMGVLPFADRTNPTGLRANVLIDYVRVSPTAYAPALP